MSDNLRHDWASAFAHGFAVLRVVIDSAKEAFIFIFNRLTNAKWARADAAHSAPNPHWFAHMHDLLTKSKNHRTTNARINGRTGKAVDLTSIGGAKGATRVATVAKAASDVLFVVAIVMDAVDVAIAIYKDCKNGEVRASVITVSGVAGAWAGAAAGSTLGASVGSVVPVFGTIIGGIVGGILGAFGGRQFARNIALKFVNEIHLYFHAQPAKKCGVVSLPYTSYPSFIQSLPSMIALPSPAAESRVISWPRLHRFEVGVLGCVAMLAWKIIMIAFYISQRDWELCVAFTVVAIIPAVTLAVSCRPSLPSIVFWPMIGLLVLETIFHTLTGALHLSTSLLSAISSLDSVAVYLQAVGFDPSDPLTVDFEFWVPWWSVWDEAAWGAANLFIAIFQATIAWMLARRNRKTTDRSMIQRFHELSNEARRYGWDVALPPLPDDDIDNEASASACRMGDEPYIIIV